jgi:hypothetical protein
MHSVIGKLIAGELHADRPSPRLKTIIDTSEQSLSRVRASSRLENPVRVNLAPRDGQFFNAF